MEDPIVATCHLCNLKVRIQADKAASARCPKCKGPIGDPKIDQVCPGCQAVNRVLRSRLAAARCGRCKQALLPAGPLPRELVLAEAYGLLGAVYADPLLARLLARPHDLVEVVSWAEELPRSIAELAASISLGEDRDRIAQLAARCKALPAKLRPEVFVEPALLVGEAQLKEALLLEAFEVLRHHPDGWRLLKQVRIGEKGASAARVELGAAAAAFERILNRLHKTDWNDLAADQAARTAVAEELFKELSRVVESWLPRPYKLEAMLKRCMTHLEEQPWAAQAVEAAPDALRKDVEAFLAIMTALITRAVSVHNLGDTASAVWPELVTPLRTAAMATAG